LSPDFFWLRLEPCQKLAIFWKPPKPFHLKKQRCAGDSSCVKGDQQKRSALEMAFMDSHALIALSALHIN
jgi:hypothetical protein